MIVQATLWLDEKIEDFKLNPGAINFVAVTGALVERGLDVL
jgi:hypothetical protein